ncbi:hypothetical protein TSTA_125770 [Talaromyces stipitatus ATCC 10500]|uniref:Uncharacterized protein n=1 Tax=Talaromyces stipitatus (strain ATCC 10500 / CBS 375.48 / QM 6759 / NRRL 1006) TaxID=441959 RepID=B8MB76_TALSN|nr:uncharacterized protein TSTA_125770 [Talaromyces stipitatus ATCC 10500]EED18865.1 hypothetical protein TSTA_125770 [Talaromyces stipitatus ATCC 10500]
MTASRASETAWRVNNWPVLAKIDTRLNFDKEDHCEFMYYKRHDMSNTRFENGTDLRKYVRDEIITTAVWKMDSKAQRIGNDGALTLVEAMEERMARMEKELADQKKKTAEQAEELADQKKRTVDQAEELADQKKRTADQVKELADQKKKVAGRNRLWWKFRVSELERIIKKTHNAARFERNEIVHGADVLNDYQALEYADRPDNEAQFKTASEGFKKAYGLQLGSFSYDKLSKAPEGVIDIISLRGNVTFLDWFSNHKEEAGVIAKQCDLAVRKWLKSIKTNGVPYPEDAVKADYKRVKELYDSVRSQEV